MASQDLNMFHDFSL